jgi:hypothetical protein
MCVVKIFGNISPEKSSVISDICKKTKDIISFSNEIEVYIQDMAHEVWGGTHLNHNHLNRISLNSNLSLAEIPIVLVHELIHLNQIHSGRLKVDDRRNCYWEGVMYAIDKLSFMEYSQLPWEKDVQYRLKPILNLINHSY